MSLGRLAQALAAAGEQRRAGVQPVPGRVVAGQQHRRDRPQPVAPGAQQPGGEGNHGGVVLAKVEIATAVKLDHATLPAAVGGELLVMGRLGRRHPEDYPAGIAQPSAEVRLVGVDEEVGVEVADCGHRLAAHEHCRRLDPADLAGAITTALGDERAVQEQRPGERGPEPGQPPGGGLRSSRGIEQARARGHRARVAVHGSDQGRGGARA